MMGYFQAGKNVFYYVGNSSMVMKPFAFILAIGFNIILLPVGIIFGLFIVLDHLGNYTDSMRQSIINAMESHSWRVDDSLLSFIFRPIIIVFLSPLFIISLIIPKVSSDAMINASADEVKQIINGAGAFKRLNSVIWNTMHRMFIYIKNAPLLLKPIVALIAIYYSMVLIILGTIFIFLIPLDWLSQIVESIRQGIVRFVDSSQERIRYRTNAFIFIPIVLVLLAPLFLIAILIPKFSSSMTDV